MTFSKSEFSDKLRIFALLWGGTSKKYHFTSIASILIFMVIALGNANWYWIQNDIERQKIFRSSRCACASSYYAHSCVYFAILSMDHVQLSLLWRCLIFTFFFTKTFFMLKWSFSLQKSCNFSKPEFPFFCVSNFRFCLWDPPSFLFTLLFLYQLKLE